MKYFRVQTGFGKDDFVSIDETELQTAMRAQITGRVAILKGGTVSGNIIQKITPDWNRIMGWSPDYKLGGEDFREIGSKRREEYELAIGEATQAVKAQIGPGGGQAQLHQ